MKGVKQHPRQIFKKHLNKNATKDYKTQNRGPLWQFCPESLDPPPPPPKGFWPKCLLPPGFSTRVHRPRAVKTDLMV